MKSQMCFHEFMGTRKNYYLIVYFMIFVIIAAPVILRMLRHFLTDQVFQKGIEIFLSKQ